MTMEDGKLVDELHMYRRRECPRTTLGWHRDVVNKDIMCTDANAILCVETGDWHFSEELSKCDEIFFGGTSDLSCAPTLITLLTASLED
jgi:hypothetical protein